MPEVKFYQNFDKDLEYIKDLFPNFRNLCGNYFSVLLKKCYPDCFGKNDKEILKFFERNKKEIIKRNGLAGKKLEQSWSKMADEFFTKVQNITKFNWKSKIYYCHISCSYICGGYNKPNIVVVCPLSQNPLATLAHELTHLHVLDILNALNLTIKDKKKLWDLYEILVSSIISKLNIKEIKHEKEIGWSKLKPLYEKVKPLWKGEFKKFVLDCVKELGLSDNV